MFNNFRKTAVLKKSYTAKDSTNNFCGPYPCLNLSSHLLQIFHIFVWNFSLEIFTDKCIENFKISS